MNSYNPGFRKVIVGVISFLFLCSGCSYHVIRQPGLNEYDKRFSQVIDKGDSIFIKDGSQLYLLENSQLVDGGIRGELNRLEYSTYRNDSITLAHKRRRVRKPEKAIFKKVYLEVDLASPEDTLFRFKDMERVMIINHDTVREVANVSGWMVISVLSASALANYGALDMFFKKDD